MWFLPTGHELIFSVGKERRFQAGPSFMSGASDGWWREKTAKGRSALGFKMVGDSLKLMGSPKGEAQSANQLADWIRLPHIHFPRSRNE